MGWNGGLVGVLSEPLIALIFVMGFDWVLVVGWVGRKWDWWWFGW